MTRDGDIPTIFNPRRSRTPSVLVTDEGVANGPFSHADSVSSSQLEQNVEPQSPANTTNQTGCRGRLKSCSGSFCSESARKVAKSFTIAVNQIYLCYMNKVGQNMMRINRVVARDFYLFHCSN